MKQIRLNAFEMNYVGRTKQGLGDRSMTARQSAARSVASLSSRVCQSGGLFAGLFLADVLGVCGGSPSPGIRHSVLNPVGDKPRRATGTYADPKKGQKVQHAQLHLFSARDRLPPRHPAAAHRGSLA